MDHTLKPLVFNLTNSLTLYILFSELGFFEKNFLYCFEFKILISLFTISLNVILFCKNKLTNSSFALIKLYHISCFPLILFLKVELMEILIYQLYKIVSYLKF